METDSSQKAVSSLDFELREDHSNFKTRPVVQVLQHLHHLHSDQNFLFLPASVLHILIIIVKCSIDSVSNY